MDANGRHELSGGGPSLSAMSNPSSASAVGRKRMIDREHETPSQRHKREKAAERQRRKRERDRQASQAALNASNSHGAKYPPPPDTPLAQPPTAPPPPVIITPIIAAATATATAASASDVDDENFNAQSITIDYMLSPEELARKDRVRTAARERQRKHRALVKQRKMRELGLDMGNEIMPGMEEVEYRVGPDGQFQQVLPHEMQHAPPPPPPPPHMGGPHEPPFPQGQPLGGQTFASTLLLSFSCAPLLKQHLLRTLAMTNEELASLEPVIAHAWDQWDQNRRIHYAEQAAKAAGGSAYGDHHTYPNDPSQPPATDFRARFHRPLVAPSPFQATTAAPSTPSSNGSAPPSDPIDPNLTGGEGGDSRGSIDPELGMARGEANRVVGKLEKVQIE